MRASILFAFLLGIYSNAIAVDGFDEEAGTLSWPQYKPTPEQLVGNESIKRVNLSYEMSCKEEGTSPEKGWFLLSKNRGKLIVEDTWILCKLSDIMNTQKNSLPRKGIMTSAYSSAIAKDLHELFPNLKMVVLMGNVADTNTLTKLAENLYKDGGGMYLYQENEKAILTLTGKETRKAAESATTSPVSAKSPQKATSSTTPKSSTITQADDPDEVTSDYFSEVRDGVNFRDGGATDWTTSSSCYSSQPSSSRSSPTYASDEYTSC